MVFGLVAVRLGLPALLGYHVLIVGLDGAGERISAALTEGGVSIVVIEQHR